MNRTLRRGVTLLVCLGVLCGAAAAWGSSKPEASGAPAGKRTITLVHHMGEATKKGGLAAICKAVEAANPGVVFDVQGIEYNQYGPLLKTKIAAGDPPDIIFGRPFTYPELIKAGEIMDLTGQPFLSRVSQFAIDGVTIDGKVWGLPIDDDIRCVFYNKDLFAKVGAKVPATKSELIAVCQKFMAAGMTPYSLPGKKANVFTDYVHLIVLPMIYASDRNFFLDIQNKKRTFSDNPAFEKALKILDETIVSFADPGDFAIEENQGNLNFAAEKYPMILNGMWMLGDVRQANPKGNFGSFAFPWSDNAAENRLLIGLDDIFMASSRTKNKDIVLKFMDYYSTPEGTKTWLKYSKLLSVIKGVKPDDPDPMAGDLLPYLDQGKIAPMTNVQALTGEYMQKFVENLQVYAAMSADKRKDTASFIKKLNADFAAIQ
jgi:ABC-type glycerol-3-phosphate transport system substrate-binding protein